jgi:catechol 2,3-dioxygenase-like lactoylglutathione lyase family enzyme
MDLNQVTIDVVNLETSTGFYESLGLTCIVWAPPRYARFECPSGGATLSLHCADKHVGAGAALYFEVDDVDACVKSLKAAGVRFDEEPADRTWRWREAWTQDPDGRRICIYHAGPDRRFPPWRIEKGARL